jgi:DNA-binding FrmR family transcriptional regulator
LGYGDRMAPDPMMRRQIINRMKRARGQLDGVIAMMEEGRPCADVVTQLAAVSKALDRAGYKVIVTELKTCLEEGKDSEQSAAQLEKLFLSLA